MFLCSGWLALSGSELDDSHVEQRRRSNVRAFMSGWSGAPRGRQVSSLNYAQFLHIWECHNHAGAAAAEIEKFIEEVCEQMPGAYGVVHFLDDENEIAPSRMMIVREGRASFEIFPKFASLP